MQIVSAGCELMASIFSRPQCHDTVPAKQNKHLGQVDVIAYKTYKHEKSSVTFKGHVHVDFTKLVK